MQSVRHERVASLLHRQFAMLLQRGSLPITMTHGLLSVVHVDVEPRLSVAHIYIGAGDGGQIDEVLAELNRKNAACRTLLASSVELRRMPELRFAPESELHRAWLVVPSHDGSGT
ncbi:MAG: ribosome-binding factor A [Candidatus Porifericomitaceae bacterium WSBS_2022_MAG_OTU9]